APVAASLLVPGQSGYLGHWVELMSSFSPVWATLPETVRSGKPRALGAPTEASAEVFALAMHELAVGPSREFVDRVDLGERTRLLDIGGGAGSYAILLAQRYPALQATVFDLPVMVAIATRMIAEAGVAERVTVRAGDYTCDGFGTGYDVAL